MTIPESVCLLIQAGALANNRDIFVLDMGAPVLIHKLAEDLIELSGLRPNRDVRIEITGLKQGEKISEVLMDNTSDLRPTSIEKIKAISTGAFAFEVFAQRVRALERSAWEGDTDEVYRQLASLNIGYNSQIPARPWPAAAASHVVPVPAVGGTLAPELS
jgi:FlaA1/EpsC-like NDP-sugar epimerase